jgi:hypothetical protein
MADENVTDPNTIDSLLEAGDFDAARAALSGVPEGDESYAVVRIKLGLFDGSLPAGAAMQKLIALMRRDANWPGAKELYQEASNQAYSSRQSSVSHSHPPPPTSDEE